MKRILEGIKACYYYLWGRVLFVTHYQRKYSQGKWFKNTHRGLGAIGWYWTVKNFLECRRAGVNLNAKWPVSSQCRVVGFDNITFDPNDLNNFQSAGTYYQAIGEIHIGSGTLIAMGVGLITANHDTDNLDAHTEAKPIYLGSQCWVGMNAVILPGVTLGDRTIVGAGSVVTKSFNSGHCIVAGNPARVIRSFL